MKINFGTIILIILFQYNVIGQEKSQPFEKVSFEKAKINGEDAAKFFIENIKYPYNPDINGYSDGYVFVSFIIDKSGQLDSILVLNEPKAIFRDVVLNAISKSSGLWKPTVFDGVILYTKYIAVFNFNKSNTLQYKKDKSFQYYKRGDMRKALKLINDAIKADPYDIASYRARANIYHKQKNQEMADHDLAKCIELNNILLFDIWF